MPSLVRLSQVNVSTHHGSKPMVQFFTVTVEHKHYCYFPQVTLIFFQRIRRVWLQQNFTLFENAVEREVVMSGLTPLPEGRRRLPS